MPELETMEDAAAAEVVPEIPEQEQKPVTSFLDRVKSGKKRKAPIIFLYGVEGIGKSTFAASATDHVIIPTEDGLSEIDCTSVPIVKNWADIVQVITELAAGGHGFKTVVIDSTSGLERIVEKQTALVWRDEKGRKYPTVNDMPFGKGVEAVLPQWEMLISGLNAIRDQGVSIILIGHARVAKSKIPGHEAFDAWAPRLSKRTIELLTEWTDALLFANYREDLSSVDVDFSDGQRQVANLKQDSERILYCSKRSGYGAKNRYNLPSELPLDWNAVMAEIIKS